MSCNNVPKTMKTGIDNNMMDMIVKKKMLFMSLMGVFIEETFKTALLFVYHQKRDIVTTNDMVCVIKYEIMSSRGCGKQLKTCIQTVQNNMDDEEENEKEKEKEPDEENKKCGEMLKLAIHKYYESVHKNELQGDSLEIGTKKMLNQVFENEFNICTNNEGVHSGYGDENDNGDDSDKNINKTLHQGQTCSCSMCLEITGLVNIDFSPEDDFDTIIWENYKKIKEQNDDDDDNEEEEEEDEEEEEEEETEEDF